MATEIERKFLVIGDLWRCDVTETQPIAQGYLNRDKERTVRIRINGEKAFMTVKGKSVGATRREWEHPIPVVDAKAMLALCDGPIISKVRRIVAHEGMTWEVDEFLGDNAGLIVAEIELETEEQQFSSPAWLGEEVTHDPRYFNSNLSTLPFRSW
jgi:adenylate cyclase